MSNSKGTPFTIHLNSRQRALLRKVADVRGTSMAAVLHAALTDYLAALPTDPAWINAIEAHEADRRSVAALLGLKEAAADAPAPIPPDESDAPAQPDWNLT